MERSLIIAHLGLSLLKGGEAILRERKVKRIEIWYEIEILGKKKKKTWELLEICVFLQRRLIKWKIMCKYNIAIDDVVTEKVRLSQRLRGIGHAPNDFDYKKELEERF